METIEKLSNRISLGASLFALLGFVAAYGISYLGMQSRLHRMADGYAECGFPFSFYGYGGFTPVSQVLWAGLVADYLIVMSVSIAVGVARQRAKRAKAS